MNVEAPRAKAIFLDAVTPSPSRPTVAAIPRTRPAARTPRIRCRVEVLLRSPLPHPPGSSTSWGGTVGAYGRSGGVGPNVSARSIGPFKSLEVIGEGGMGVVFMAEQAAPVRRKVALKVIKPGMDTRQVDRPVRGRAPGPCVMDHPNIAKVLNAGATDTGRPYFVMELVRGIPIGSTVTSTPPCPRWRRAVQLVRRDQARRSPWRRRNALRSPWPSGSAAPLSPSRNSSPSASSWIVTVPRADCMYSSWSQRPSRPRKSMATCAGR